MNNRVNIIAVVLAIAVFVGIIAYSQSKKEGGAPATETETTTGDQTEAPTSAPAPSPTPATPVATPVAPATVAPAATPASAATMLGAEILVSNAHMISLQTNSPAQYSAQVVKLSSAISALEMNPNDGKQWIIAGEVAEDFGKPELAERAYLKSVEVEPGIRGGWNHLGTLYLGRQSFFQAVWAYEGLVKYHPSDSEAQELLARAKAFYNGER